MKKIEGIFPVLITPMFEDETINWQGYKENINYYLNKNVAGIVINGSTGEFVSLTKEERYKAVEMAVAEIKDKVPLLVGTAAETTSETIEYTKQAEEAGATGALLINSYYAHPLEDEIYAHFKTVAESVEFPVMIYNNPFTSGVNISTETLLKVGKDVGNITHVKESSGEIRKVRDLARQGADYLNVFCGSDDLAMESFLVGATGWISVISNIVPELTKELYESFKANDIERAWRINDELLPLCEFLEESGKLVQITKRALDLKGLSGGSSRKPRLPLSAEEDRKLVDLMKGLNQIKH